ncbi:peptidase M56 family protein [Cellulomonas sp. JH27-2]|uniref:peptidase M56 family protein n=1 Tax=Cellulomonas sp. JH27-2 TaxID=2774139 RepID=UPI001785B07C|nr:peptidase M56 family protein [Cellulomonas sp. JH27-2]MBD8059486.1 peptidase M56 family protein [Cellulomonas sp. JH27-2]
MTATIDPEFAAALRRSLVAESLRAPRRPWWRRRATTVLAVVAGLSIAGGAAAVGGTGLLPGGTAVTQKAAPVTVTRTGPATLDLGPHVDGANAVDVQITCLDAGTVRFPDGAWSECSAADVGTTSAWTGYQLPLGPDDTTITIDASAGMRWRAVTQYVEAHATAWATNADGYTYGVANDAGMPDLVSVMATNGRAGYAWNRDLRWAENGGGGEPTSPADAVARQKAREGQPPVSIPVYESDGVTVVGEFTMS